VWQLRVSGTGCRPELEDVGAAAVADRVEEPAGGAYRSQVDVGVHLAGVATGAWLGDKRIGRQSILPLLLRPRDAVRGTTSSRCLPIDTAGTHPSGRRCGAQASKPQAPQVKTGVCGAAAKVRIGPASLGTELSGQRGGGSAGFQGRHGLAFARAVKYEFGHGDVAGASGPRRWRDEVAGRVRRVWVAVGWQADQAPSGRQAFVFAVSGPARTGGKLGCAVVRHS
jgi:hypothetical protein